jgi:DNA-binding transcriptional regulator YbjK
MIFEKAVKLQVPLFASTHYWPKEDEPRLQALTDDVQAKALAYRQARQALTQAERTWASARQAVYEAQQALSEAQHEAAIITRCPELWQRRAQALAARDADPALQNFDRPGVRMRHKVAHEQALQSIQHQITAALREAAGVSSEGG